jgi:hypothetical protein
MSAAFRHGVHRLSRAPVAFAGPAAEPAPIGAGGL